MLTVTVTQFALPTTTSTGSQAPATRHPPPATAAQDEAAEAGRGTPSPGRVRTVVIMAEAGRRQMRETIDEACCCRVRVSVAQPVEDGGRCRGRRRSDHQACLRPSLHLVCLVEPQSLKSCYSTYHIEYLCPIHGALNVDENKN